MNARVGGLLVLVISLLVIFLLLRGALKAPSRPRRGLHAHINADGSAKRAYRSAPEAAAAAAEYQHDFGQRMNPYKCAQGDHWHIGHAH